MVKSTVLHGSFRCTNSKTSLWHLDFFYVTALLFNVLYFNLFLHKILFFRYLQSVFTHKSHKYCTNVSFSVTFTKTPVLMVTFDTIETSCPKLKMCQLCVKQSDMNFGMIFGQNNTWSIVYFGFVVLFRIVWRCPWTVFLWSQ